MSGVEVIHPGRFSGSVAELEEEQKLKRIQSASSSSIEAFDVRIGVKGTGCSMCEVGLEQEGGRFLPLMCQGCCD